MKLRELVQRQTVRKWLNGDSSPGLAVSKAEPAWFRGYLSADLFFGK